MATPHCYYCNASISNPAARFCPVCQQPLILHERYRLLKILGQGGFGVVYEVEDLRLHGRRCALKKIGSPSLAEQRQIEAEAGILITYASQFHFIPDIYDLWSENAQTYLVMELIQGQPLDQLVPPAWPAPRVEFFLQTSLASLAQLHDVGIIHRDIKPENIVLTKQGSYVFLDFGIAKQGAKTMTAARALSLDYAPPEQLQGKSTDARSDLFSLAATAYHLLTGQPPENVGVRLASKSPVTPPSRLVPGVPPRLDRMLVSMLALDPAARPPSARAAMQLLAAKNPAATLLPKTALPAAPATIPIRPAQSSNSRSMRYLAIVLILAVLGLGYRQIDSTDEPSKSIPAFVALPDSPMAENDPAPPAPVPVREQRGTAPEDLLQRKLEGLSEESTTVQVVRDGEVSITSSNLPDAVSTRLQTNNFIVNAHFMVPYGPSSEQWSAGFLFRQTSPGEHYGLYFTSQGSWNLILSRSGASGPRIEKIQSGWLSNQSFQSGETNELWLCVDGDIGYLFVNGTFISLLDTSHKREAGDLLIAAGFTKAPPLRDPDIQYSNFLVDTLP